MPAINKAKINLGELRFPNAKKLLFGDDFPSLASKQADLSHGLSKTLSLTTGHQFPQRSGPSHHFGSRTAPMQHTFHSAKYAQTHAKKGFFHPQSVAQQESTSTHPSGNK